MCSLNLPIHVLHPVCLPLAFRSKLSSSLSIATSVSCICQSWMSWIVKYTTLFTTKDSKRIPYLNSLIDYIDYIQGVPGGIARLRESVSYVKLYRYNPKHLCPKLNGYGDNGQRKVWASLVLKYCTPSVTSYLSNAPARQRDMVMQWPWRVRYTVGSSDVTR